MRRDQRLGRDRHLVDRAIREVDHLPGLAGGVSRGAVVDACCLVPYNHSSLLLTLAGHRLFEPRWSEASLEETYRALTNKIGLDKQRAARRRGGQAR